METYKIWEGTRTFLPGDDSEYTVEVIVAEELGMFEDVDYDGYSGRTTYVYRTEEGEIVVQPRQVEERHRRAALRFNLPIPQPEEAAIADGFEPVLRDARLI
jgi:hypothetical protein